MKKNKMMRLAAVLLVMTMLTTCAISGTFAKYTTTVEGSDAARVAKWGIGKDFTGTSTFSASYSTDVAAENGTDLVVAPGTTDSGVYKLTGTPETAYEVTFAFNAVEDVFLKAGTYEHGADYADSMDIAAGTMTEDYHPIKWTVTLVNTNGTISGTGALANGDNAFDTLAEVATAINATKIAFAPNKECDVAVTLTWTWAIDQNDQADTILGNLAAGTPALETPALMTDGADYNLDVAYEFALTATQVNA